MNFTTRLELPFQLGGTVEENIAILDDYFFNNKTFGTDLEGFIIAHDADSGQEETWKIVSIIEDGKCVTARVDFGGETVSFAGVSIGFGDSLPVEETAKVLRTKGFEVITQKYDVVLPEHLLTIEPGGSICYWDKHHFSREDFLRETVHPG
ncbi:hypothetical protein [Corynebacterium sp. UBA2622]|uniref:hypothetical protein n=1 Tax=Corynebacterium sp. UBA2622 TaxID=1946393 RepID=UPI0025BDD4DF|nr:hypothetical protein [Corynebacterium sp. UBA2622]